MTDVAGLVVGVAALWQTAVTIYELVDSSRQYGMDYEILNVKFEVERVRLVCWGDAVGLKSLVVSRDSNQPPQSSGAGDTQASNEGPNPRPDPRLNREDIRTAVIRLLSCIQHAFEDTSRLQDRYGLQPYSSTDAAIVLQSEETNLPPSQTQRILHGVFKRAYENLRKVARDRQRDTPLTRRTVWAVRDRKKFMVLVAELRGFNDSLESLFPDAQARAAEAMRSDIDAAVGIRELALLQQATAGEHEALSERVSIRLDELGVSLSARTELLSVSGARSDTDSEATVENVGNAQEEAQEEADEEIRRDDREGGQQTGPKMTELEKRLGELELFVSKKNSGALTTRIFGPYSGLAHVSAIVYWDGEKHDRDPPVWVESEKGFVGVSHAAFELYKRKKYMMKHRRDKYESPDSEDYVLLDPESHVKLENVNPGTVTVEGFGLECWDFEETKPREQTIFVNRSKLPVLRACRLLRRLNEIQTKSGKFGWSPTTEELNLKEFVGTLGIVYYDQNAAKDPKRWIGNLFDLMNRTDIFADFLTESTVGLQWASPASDHCIGIWDFLRQIILSWELAVRLKHYESGHLGFTPRILASLIVSDLWLKHVKIVLADQKIETEGLERPETAEEKAKAEEFKENGNDSMKHGEYQKAVDLYTEAMKIDLGNAVYRCNRSAALIGIDNFEAAEEDAYVATQLDPKYAKAWSRMGMAILKQGQGKRAKKAYERALRVAGKDGSPAMRKGLADAEARIKEAVKAINEEPDDEKAHNLRSAFLDEDWEIMGKTLELHSLVHEQQVEGLLHFAERIKWPYINEVRDYAEDAYSALRSGSTLNIHLHDWLFGITLPGKWFAFKIMTALILCTPSLRDKVGIAHYYDCGLSLPTRSYWRVRTVLGRVLGCLPGVISLCGWIGPCPRVDFEPSLEVPTKPRHIRIKTRRVAPIEHHSDSADGIIHLGGHHNPYYSATRIQPNEEIDPYLADMKDSSKWIIPEPPVRDISTCSIESIKLTKLPLRTDIAQKAASSSSPDNDSSDLLDIENETEYRASIVFRRDDNTPDPITYKLYTNPIFVIPPACHPGPKGDGSHEVHMRELRYYRNIWSIERLKEHTPEADLDENEGEAPVMVINATGKGAEALARAWCSERGRNAVIRKEGGPCFVCAVRAAGLGGLGTGVLIWTG
ncbi:small glutamine-rich tetratricopeptide repeat-containing protein 2 [Dichotomopilus funicola]|uniref:Small glutamine-rich tetratricopeptide repeat-containing protein 2 n=1 Tax=Dichotomopilus funicola TaxID=1934379 RepID=A0AAN6V4M1_9PEZI|nr:small glutamine-rich tetratricopeptide repeat-containing protein 2 [Dichotomopilus funicola]